AALSRMLFARVSDRLHDEWRGKRLAIVATGALEYLPFAALPLPESDRPAPGAGMTPKRSEGVVPLVPQREIVNIPCASVLAALRREAAGRRPARRVVAILADPVFEKTDPRVKSKPGATRPVPASSGPAVPGRVRLRADLTRLPFSREEANAIAA